MFNSRKFWALSLPVLASGAFACCVVSNGARVQLANEKVVIVWDQAHHIEHFVREARFDTTANDFGFIVPTPSVPALGLAKPTAYTLIEALIPPPPSTKALPSGGSTGGTPPAHVQVIRTETVGDYKATIVKASDGNSMNAWLKANGFVSRPSMITWLNYYAQKKWVFTAFKFMKKTPTGAWTQAIRLSFKTDMPRYPYKMPKDTWPSGWRRPLNVYFVAPSAIRAKYIDSGRSWEANIRWTGLLQPVVRDDFVKSLGLKNSNIPNDATVTVFENQVNHNGYDMDLAFEATQANSATTWFFNHLLKNDWLPSQGLTLTGTTFSTSA